MNFLESPYCKKEVRRYWRAVTWRELIHATGLMDVMRLQIDYIPDPLVYEIQPNIYLGHPVTIRLIRQKLAQLHS